MKALVFHGVGDIRLEDVKDPNIEAPSDAIVRVTSSAICGTDLHMVRGTMPGMVPGTILGHEGVGIVEECGSGVRNLRKGDRVVIASTIACGYCAYCRRGYYAQCDNANPNGKRAGTAFFGGPQATGPFHGLQAEYARVPFANVGAVKIPDEISDDQAILLSDIFPTGYFGADIARIDDGNTVAVFGCGPVGMFAIASAFMMGAGRVFAIDSESSRLDTARSLGAEVIDFAADDPVQALLDLTGGIGVDRAIDAVGVDAEKAPAAGDGDAARFESELEEIAPSADSSAAHWRPGSGPTQAVEWAVGSLAKAGTLSIIGVYPPTVRWFPLGAAMQANLKMNMGNCNHRRYIPELIEIVRSGTLDPLSVLSRVAPLSSAVEAYEAFDSRKPGWMKVELQPGA